MLMILDLGTNKIVRPMCEGDAVLDLAREAASECEGAAISFVTDAGEVLWFHAEPAAWSPDWTEEAMRTGDVPFC